MTNEQINSQIEAKVFKRLVKHLSENNDVQNIDLMILAGFCRNCLAKWYKAAAEEEGIELSYDQTRQIIYGMPYEKWKDKYQTPATEAQQKAYNEKHNKNI